MAWKPGPLKKGSQSYCQFEKRRQLSYIKESGKKKKKIDSPNERPCDNQVIWLSKKKRIYTNYKSVITRFLKECTFHCLLIEVGSTLSLLMPKEIQYEENSFMLILHDLSKPNKSVYMLLNAESSLIILQKLIYKPHNALWNTWCFYFAAKIS